MFGNEITMVYISLSVSACQAVFSAYLMSAAVWFECFTIFMKLTLVFGATIRVLELSLSASAALQESASHLRLQLAGEAVFFDHGHSNSGEAVRSSYSYPFI
jgi:hypothetical protein